jgi:hypothetical protein
MNPQLTFNQAGVIMPPNLRVIRDTTLTKQYWKESKTTVVRVMSQDVYTITYQDLIGTQVEVHTPLGIVTVYL